MLLIWKRRSLFVVANNFNGLWYKSISNSCWSCYFSFSLSSDSISDCNFFCLRSSFRFCCPFYFLPTLVAYCSFFNFPCYLFLRSPQQLNLIKPLQWHTFHNFNDKYNLIMSSVRITHIHLSFSISYTFSFWKRFQWCDKITHFISGVNLCDGNLLNVITMGQRRRRKMEKAKKIA